MLVAWHVDDIKSSHMKQSVLDEFNEWVSKKYGKERAVVVTRGKKHACLGMLLDYSEPGKVKVDMKQHVKDMIEDFPFELKNRVASPANENLFKLTNGTKIDKMSKEIFHTHAMKTLFLVKRARPTH